MVDDNGGGTQLPPKPQRPNDEDCCKSDCEMCVFNIYEKKIAEWEKTCRQMIQNRSLLFSEPSAFSEMKFTPFCLRSITQMSNNTCIYKFQISETEQMHPEGKYSINLNINIGQHVILKYKDGEKQTLITRSYTPISDCKLHSHGCFEVMIKVYPEGAMSQYVRSWKEGDIVYWRGPFGDFTYFKNKFEHIVMCCAGTGIAPMFQIIKNIVDDEEDETLVNLLYSCKKYQDVLLHNEICQFRNYWNFSSCIFITQGDLESIRYGDVVEKGRITSTTLQRLLSGKNLNKTLVLICGDDSFNTDMEVCVKDFGISEANIRIF